MKMRKELEISLIFFTIFLIFLVPTYAVEINDDPTEGVLIYYGTAGSGFWNGSTGLWINNSGVTNSVNEEVIVEKLTVNDIFGAFGFAQFASFVNFHNRTEFYDTIWGEADIFITQGAEHNGSITADGNISSLSSVCNGSGICIGDAYTNSPYWNLSRGETTELNTTYSTFIKGSLKIAGTFRPLTDRFYSIGLKTIRWKDGYFQGNVTAGNFTATDNVSADYFIGDGSQLTGISTAITHEDYLNKTNMPNWVNTTNINNSNNIEFHKNITGYNSELNMYNSTFFLNGSGTPTHARNIVEFELKNNYLTYTPQKILALIYDSTGSAYASGDNALYIDYTEATTGAYSNYPVFINHDSSDDTTIEVDTDANLDGGGNLYGIFLDITNDGTKKVFGAWTQASSEGDAVGYEGYGLTRGTTDSEEGIGLYGYCGSSGDAQCIGVYSNPAFGDNFKDKIAWASPSGTFMFDDGIFVSTVGTTYTTFEDAPNMEHFPFDNSATGSAYFERFLEVDGDVWFDNRSFFNQSFWNFFNVKSLLFGENEETQVGQNSTHFVINTTEEVSIIGNVSMTGEVCGTPMLLQYWQGSRTSDYYFYNGNVQGSAEIGYVMPRGGSVTGISINYEHNTHTDNGDLIFMPSINGVEYNEVSITHHWTGPDWDVVGWNTSKKGELTFSAGDHITMYGDFSAGLTGEQRSQVGMIEVTYDC